LTNTVSDGTHNIFAGPGSAPTDTAAWGLSTTTATTGLESWINGNYTGVSTTNSFPKAAFRGPYLAHLDTDPWGNQYLLNAGNLNNTFHAFIISAGPNGSLETTKNQTNTTPITIGGDDIISVID